MRLANKITLANVSLALLVLLANGAVRISREYELFESETQRDHRLLVKAIGSAVSRTFAREGLDAALAVVERGDADIADVKVRWVWLDVPPGHLEGPRTRHPVGTVEGVPRSVLDDGRRGPAVLRTYLPLRLGPRDGAIEISESMASQEAYVQTSIRNTLVGTAALAGLFGLAAIWMGRRLLGNPLQQLTDLSRRIEEGDLSARTAFDRKDEIGDLARQMNAMGASLATSQLRLREETNQKVTALDQLRHAERLTTVGKLASGVAHELGTPLNVVLGRAKMIATGEVRDAEAQQSAAVVVEQVRAMTAIIRSLLDFARPRPPLRDLHELASLAEHCVQLLKPLAEKRTVTLSFQRPEVPMQARVDAGQVQQVLTNLVMNAVHASRAHGTVTLVLTAVDARSPERPDAPLSPFVRIDVTDEGEGISPEHLPRIFEPFFTTKQVGEGTGLGLSISYGLVREHGGFIEVDSRVGRGTRFALFLPRGEKA